MKTPQERIAELERIRNKYYAIIDSIIDLEPALPITDAMRTVLDEVNMRVTSCNGLIENYELELSETK